MNLTDRSRILGYSRLLGTLYPSRIANTWGHFKTTYLILFPISQFTCTRHQLFIYCLHVVGGFGTFHSMLNSFIHLVMYTYYGMAALGPKYQKYLWWKKYMTSMQIVSVEEFISHIILYIVGNSQSVLLLLPR